jgi:hypothetical protein
VALDQSALLEATDAAEAAHAAAADAIPELQGQVVGSRRSLGASGSGRTVQRGRHAYASPLARPSFGMVGYVPLDEQVLGGVDGNHRQVPEVGGGSRLYAAHRCCHGPSPTPAGRSPLPPVPHRK